MAPSYRLFVLAAGKRGEEPFTGKVHHGRAVLLLMGGM